MAAVVTAGVRAAQGLLCQVSDCTTCAASRAGDDAAADQKRLWENKHLVIPGWP